MGTAACRLSPRRLFHLRLVTSPTPLPPLFFLGAKVWSNSTFQLIGEHIGHDKPVGCMALDANFLFSGSDDCTIRMWDTVPGSRCGRLANIVRLLSQGLLSRAAPAEFSDGFHARGREWG